MRKTPNSQQVPINIVGSSKFGLSPKISLEKTYNMFESDGWLINMPGWRRVIDFYSAGEGRGSFVSVRGNFAIVVVNQSVLRISTTLAVTPIGSLTTSTGEVWIDENLAGQICIVDGQNAYIYYWPSGIPNLTPQTMPFVPNTVVYHNQYFLFGNAATMVGGASPDPSLWYQYLPASATTIVQVTPTTTKISTKPDFAQAVFRIPGQSGNVMVMGHSVSEVWTFVQSQQSPYILNQSFSIDYGCLSIDTVATSDKYIIWLGTNQTNNPVITIFAQQTAEAVSTDGIDLVLNQIQFPAESTAILYKQNGHLFYQLTFFNPADNLTLVYDVDAKKFYHGSDQNLDYHPARSIFYFNDKTYFISLNNASLYEMSPLYRNITEDIANNVIPVDVRLVYPQQRIRICEPIRQADSAPFRLNQLVFTIRQGNEDILDYDDQIWIIHEDGRRVFSEDNRQMIPEYASPNAGAYIDYYRGRVDLSLSKDGGETFSNTVGRRMNTLAHRQNIMRWESLGSGNDIVPKFRFWSLGSMVVNNGFVEMVA